VDGKKIVDFFFVIREIVFLIYPIQQATVGNENANNKNLHWMCMGLLAYTLHNMKRKNINDGGTGYAYLKKVFNLDY